MKCFLESLGCAKNLVDSEIMLALLVKEGYDLTSAPEEAEIIIINTCGFIESAREESVNTILEMTLMKESGSCKKLIVTGCLSQRYAKELRQEIPEVDAFIGTGNFHLITEVIENLSRKKKINLVNTPYAPLNIAIPRVVTTPFYYSYLKIAEGCNHKCSFCVIPELRGKYRSRLPEDIIKEARELAKNGVRELNVIAQDTTGYGQDLEGDYSLVKLLAELEKIEDLRWIRLLYFYPSTISDEVLSFMQESEKICNYIDLPLQHCEGNILKKMERGGNKESLLKLIDRIRTRIPDVPLRTSMIAGFPGETEKDFESLMDFIEKVEFDRLGVFEYSKEEGTKAGELKGQVRKKIKKERLHRLMTLQRDISLKKNRSLKGTIQEVLIEEILDSGPYKTAGRTRRDAPDIDGRIYLVNTGGNPGDIIRVKIIDGNEYDLMGEEFL